MKFHELSTFTPRTTEDDDGMKGMYVESLRNNIRLVMLAPEERTIT